MKTSKNGIELIKTHEGCILEGYLCPAGVPTIGYGHTRTADLGKTITPEKAEKLLIKDIENVEKALYSISHTLTQNQFDALVSFGFNVGVQAFKQSTLISIVKKDPYSHRIRREFMKWVYVRGRITKGLKNRRIAEADLYVTY